MLVTQADVNNDLRMLIQNIEDDSKPLVNPKSALKISMVWPLSCVLCYVVAMLFIALKFEPYIDHFDNQVTVLKEYGFVFIFGGMSILFSLFIGAALYGPALAYLTLSKEVRESSIIISQLKKLVIKLGRFFFLSNLGLAIISLWIPELLVAAPFLIMFSFLIMQGIVSAEATRYGVAPVIGKLTKLAKKI
ncbi:hypothetical protein FEI17_27235 (plasmid) [Kosakonia radicincitans]|uniref:hypothetical protein n=1 Tax=Kosakonia radicincitans TaxID=283686 RepID=UPI0011EEF1E8|nr:hypothetical protein [Kosakonia radicincitans]QEM94325.1 hypothetical protein FEI17_27235 [Kosakonia radicincitans]